MKIKPPLGSRTVAPNSEVDGFSRNSVDSLSEYGESVDHEMPYRWNKETNSFEFADGRMFFCPYSGKTEIGENA